MAEDVLEEKKASVKKTNSVFGTPKQPSLIIYRLLKQNDVKMREDTPLYPPYIRFPNYDIIQWEGGTRAIRWLPGETTIFVDEQEKNGRVVPENIRDNPNNRFEIFDGEIKVRPHQKTKIQFLDMCNRNAESEYKTGTLPGIFARYSEDKKVEQLAAKQIKQKAAIEKSFNADEYQIAFHAKYLGIPMIDGATSSTRTLEAVMADYRQIAMDKPEQFLKTFDDEDLKLKFKIERAIDGKFISLSVIPGKAAYASTKAEICDVPVNTDIKYVVDALFMFSQTKSGTDFIKKVSEFNK